MDAQVAAASDTTIDWLGCRLPLTCTLLVCAGVALGKCIEYGYEYANQVAQAVKRAASGAATRSGDEAVFV